jgi:hypothetical protein
MAEFFASGRVVDLVLAIVVVETLVLVAWRLRTGGGLPVAALAVNLLSGAALMLALRAALVQAGWVWVAVPLCASFAVHLGDLALRWERGSAEPR